MQTAHITGLSTSLGNEKPYYSKKAVGRRQNTGPAVENHSRRRSAARTVAKDGLYLNRKEAVMVTLNENRVVLITPSFCRVTARRNLTGIF